MSIRVAAAFERRWRVLWATTYTFDPIFFESFLLPRLGDPPLNVTVLADRNRLADAWQNLGDTTPWRGSRANRDYLVRGVSPTAGAFHPKTYFLADERTGLLFVGSGNLGMNGLESGKEVFSRFDAADEGGLRGIRAWRAWMDALVARLDDKDVRARWNAALLRAPWLIGAETPEPSTFVSNWDRPILEQLLDGVSAPVDELHVTAPFYDTSLGALGQLIARLRPARLTVLLGRDTSVDGPALLRMVSESGSSAQLLGLRPDTYVHAKLIGIVSGDLARLLSGSANLSGVALVRAAATDSSANVECGTIVDLTPDALRDFFLPPPPPDDLVVVPVEELDVGSLRLAESDGIGFLLHLRAAVWQPDGRIRIDVRTALPLGAGVSAGGTTAAIEGGMTALPFGDETARFVWVIDLSGVQVSNKVAIDDPRALSAALEERDPTQDDRPSGVEAADLETPIGQMLARLHAACIFDFDDTPSARRVAQAAEVADDPEFWERLAQEDLRGDPRVAHYSQFRDDLPLLDGIFLDLARMRDMVRPLSELHAVPESQSPSQNPGTGPKWSPQVKLQVRLFNVLERWCGALTDPRLSWVASLAPVANFVALASALRECWIEGYLRQDRVISLVGVLLAAFVRGERRPGFLGMRDDDDRALATRALAASAAPALFAGLAYASVRQAQAGLLTYLFSWQPGIASGLSWGALRPDAVAGECATELTGVITGAKTVEARLSWAVTYLDDPHWSEAVERELGLSGVKLTTENFARGFGAVLSVAPGVDLLGDRRIVELVRRALAYRKTEGCVVQAGTNRLSIRVGDRVFARIDEAVTESEDRVSAEGLADMTANGTAFAELFPLDDAVA